MSSMVWRLLFLIQIVAIGYLSAATGWPFLGLLAIAFVVEFVSAVYIISAMRIYRNQRFRPRAELIPIDLDHEGLPEAIRNHFETAHEAVIQDGFRLIVATAVPNASPLTTGFCVLYFRRESYDSAKAVFVSGKTTGLTAKTVDFTTRFSDGTILWTNNSPVLEEMALPRRVIKTSFPGLSDLRRLYQIHRVLKKRLSKTEPKPVSLLETEFAGRPLEYMQSSMEEIHEMYIETGYLVLREDGYGPSVRGAMLIALKYLRPVRYVRMRWRRRKSQRLLKEIEPLIGTV